MPSERVFRTLDGVVGGDDLRDGAQVLGVGFHEAFEHGPGNGGQGALASLAGLVAQAGLAGGLPAVEPMVNRDAAHRKDDHQLPDGVPFGREQQALAAPSNNLVFTR